jgi:transcriptional regulator with XRE-family HTH domain
MQELFKNSGYILPMSSLNLKDLREKAGLSMRELGRKIGEDHSNIRYWEQTGKIPRSDVLVPMAEVLGVSLEELLGLPKRKNIQPVGGQLGEVFRQVSKLPRRRQQSVIKVVEALVKQNEEELAAK